MRLLAVLACCNLCGVLAVRLKKRGSSTQVDKRQAQDAQIKSAFASWLQFGQETQQTFFIPNKAFAAVARKMGEDTSIAMTRETIDTVRNKEITTEAFPKTAQVLKKAGCKCEMPDKEADWKEADGHCQVDIYFDAGMYAPRNNVTGRNDAGMWALYIDDSETLADRAGEFKEMLWSGERRHLSKAGFEGLLADKSMKFVLRFSSAAGLSKLEVDQSGTGTKHTQLAGKNWVLAAGEWQFEGNERGHSTIIDLNSGTYMANVKGYEPLQHSAELFMKWLAAFLTKASGHPTKVQSDGKLYPDDFFSGPNAPFVKPDQLGFECVLCGQGPDDFMAEALTPKPECIHEASRPKGCVCHVTNCGA